MGRNSLFAFYKINNVSCIIDYIYVSYSRILTTHLNFTIRMSFRFVASGSLQTGTESTKPLMNFG